MIIDLELQDGFFSTYSIETWLREVVKAVDMEILIDPIVEWCGIEGNEGVTGVVVITTSHLAIHIWENERYAKVDLYSCKDFDPDDVLDMCEKLSATKASYMVIDRNSPISKGYYQKTGVKFWV